MSPEAAVHMIREALLAAFWLMGVPTGIWLGWYGVLGSGPLRVYGFWVGLVIGLVTVSLGLVVGLRQVADRAVRRDATSSSREDVDSGGARPSA